MKTMRITDGQWQQIQHLLIRLRRDWPAVFSTNCKGEIWPFATYRYTRDEERVEVRGVSAVIDEVADEYLILRPEGGRFFIDRQGAYYEEAGQPTRHFVLFQFSR